MDTTYMFNSGHPLSACYRNMPMTRNELGMQGREAMLVPGTLSGHDTCFYFSVIQASLHPYSSFLPSKAKLPSGSCQDGLKDTFPAYNKHPKFSLSSPLQVQGLFWWLRGFFVKMVLVEAACLTALLAKICCLSTEWERFVLPKLSYSHHLHAASLL